MIYEKEHMNHCTCCRIKIKDKNVSKTLWKCRVNTLLHINESVEFLKKI